MGGNDGFRKNDIWKSTDGTTWTQVDANGSSDVGDLNAPWNARETHQVVLSNNALWLLGGHDGTRRNDVWKSLDGSIWTGGDASVITTTGTIDINTVGTYTITYLSTDTAGNAAINKTRAYTVTAAADTEAPAALTLSLKDSSNSGITTDLITSDNTPIITISNAETGSTINIIAAKQGATSVTGTSPGNGDVTLSTLSDGEWSITATATYASGNESDPSTALVITIDTGVPVITVNPTTITLEAGSTPPNFFEGVSTDDGSENGFIAPWSGRLSHQVVSFNNALWLLGGNDGSRKNDVWKSINNGVTWTQVDANGDEAGMNAPWDALEGHQVVSFNDAIWLLGGRNGNSSRTNDVWKSMDGTTWEEVTTTGTKWSARTSHQVVSFNSVIWLLGGNNGANTLNDIWKSTDGTSWIQVDANGDDSGSNAPWPARQNHQVVSFNNALWLLGGDGRNDVWRSTDGTSWTQVDANGSEEGRNATWSGRFSHQVVSFNNALWLLGGVASSVRKNDVWKSTDGTTWTQVDANGSGEGLNAPWSGRSSLRVVPHNNAMWLLGGYDGSRKNDVWKSLDGSIWTGGDASTITSSGTFDINTAGNYTRTYSSADTAENAAVAKTRTYTVTATADTAIIPVITVNPTTITLEVGSTLPNLFDGVSTDDGSENGFIAPWSTREDHQAVSFNNALWLLGGDSGGTLKNDVWKSVDGATWTQVDSNGSSATGDLNAPWSARYAHEVVLFNNAIWLLGGYDGTHKNDIWKSMDGTSWTEVITTGAKWSGRNGHQVVSFNNTLWLLGGNDGSFKNDVWKSADGETWTQVDANGSESGLNAPWSPRRTHEVVLFDGAIWLSGGDQGGRKNDVWKSTDGAIWTQVDANGSADGRNAPWDARNDHQVVSNNNALWLLGGSGNNNTRKNDIWKSTDGTIWTQVDANGSEDGLNAPWSGRLAHQVVSFNNALWLLGGNDGSVKNDVWKSLDGSIWTGGDASAIITSGTVDVNTIGTYTITYSSTNVEGNAAAPKTRAYIVTAAAVVDTEAPDAPTLSLKQSSNSGINTDGITNDNTPTITISNAETGSTINITATKQGATSVTGTSAGNGDVTLSTLSDGEWSITAIATDASENTSDPSTALVITIDTAVPVITVNPTTITLEAGSTPPNFFEGVSTNDGSENGLIAPWSARNVHQVVSFNNALWLLGGYDGSLKNDIWKSTDGATWTQVDSNGSSATGDLNAPWSAREHHQVVSFNSALWLLGGIDGGGDKNDIWKSMDGITWTEVTTTGTKWSARRYHQAISFNGALWLLGGHGGSFKNDVWTSTDGVSWTQVDANGSGSGENAPWSARGNHQVVSFNNALWLLGGYDGSQKNDVWKSTDGTTWNQVDANGSSVAGDLNAPWSGRSDGHPVVLFNNALWLLGGYDGHRPPRAKK